MDIIKIETGIKAEVNCKTLHFVNFEFYLDV